MGVRFGRHLRDQRIARGLTQAQLGAGAYATAYISLVESGRREPSPELVREMAARLTPTPPEPQATARHETAYLLHALTARQAWDLREYQKGVEEAAAAADAATDAGSPTGWWEMTHLQAECLLSLRQLPDCVRTAEELLAHPITRETDELAARAHQMLAAAHHGLGRMDAATAHAHNADRLAAGLPEGSETRIRAVRSLVVALADSGQLERAWEACRRLSDLTEPGTADDLAGEAEWAIGCVAFLRGNHHTGAEHHERAGRLLSPANDLRLWARFNKDSAAARLRGGIVDPQTLETINRAELAYSIIGPSPSEKLELELIRAGWLHAAGDTEAALPLLREAVSGRHLIGHRLAAQATRLLGQALLEAGRPDEAAAALSEAHHEFSLAGMPDDAEEAARRLAALNASTALDPTRRERANR